MNRWCLAVVLALASCTSPQEEAGFRAVNNARARAWCDTMGIRVTGISCDTWGYCTVAHEHGAPFTIDCSDRGCHLRETAK